ncbi:MAG: hypothetical protein L0Z50_04390 [Verrucomicrobiales bacterium]|nr:hypothetical protein [Verrucomicrobiales bacterium]
MLFTYDAWRCNLPVPGFVRGWKVEASRAGKRAGLARRKRTEAGKSQGRAMRSVGATSASAQHHRGRMKEIWQ